MEQDKKEEAKFFRDKLVLEIAGDKGKSPSVNLLGISSENYEILSENIKKEKAEIKSLFIDFIRDRKINEATEMIVEYILKNNHLYTTKEDLKSEMWIYKGGIYIANGRSEVKAIMRDILGNWFNNFYYNQVIVKLEADTFIEKEEFFSSNYDKHIPVKNGILDIINLTISPYEPNKIFFTKLPVRYDKEATCPKIEEFLKQVLSKEDDIKVFYEMVGFVLLKEYTYEKAFMFVGDGRNGKGKSIELIKRLVGIENTCSIALASLNPDSFLISEMFGKLVNLAGDIGNQDLKEVSMFKALTGRDLIGGKRKFQKNINFVNYAKFIFGCNELPMVYDLSRGFWSRWVLFEYPYTFVTRDEYNKSTDKTNLKIKDESIIDKITTPEEMSGFLNKALEGLHRLVKNKDFSTTQGSEEIKSLWIRKSNSFIAFCLDNLEESYEGFIPKKDLRKRYSDYCKLHKATPKSDVVVKIALQNTFGAYEERKQIDSFNYDHVWGGLRWKN